MIGSVGPHTSNPSKYIRYIYNRVILENSTVRAAAVSSLARFAMYEGDGGVLRSRVLVLLRRCLDDVDDEVRDRAAMFLAILDRKSICDVYIGDDSTFAWAALERNISAYIAGGSHSLPFDIKATPLVTRDQEETERMRVKAAAQESVASTAVVAPVAGATSGGVVSGEAMADEISGIDALKKLGRVIKSGVKVVDLTESETEYVVGVRKHIFANHFVFQFIVRNTLQECHLESVGVAMEVSEEEAEECGMSLDSVVPIASLEYDVPASVWVIWNVDPNAEGSPSATFGCTLKFIAKEIDPSNGMPEEDGYDDEYALESVDVGLADYVTPLFIGDFERNWKESAAGEVVETYSLTAVQSIKGMSFNLIV